MISVIIPIYNSAPGLTICFVSLLKQTMSGWDAICVNDGSKDESMHILERTPQKSRALALSNKKIAAYRRPATWHLMLQRENASFSSTSTQPYIRKRLSS